MRKSCQRSSRPRSARGGPARDGRRVACATRARRAHWPLASAPGSRRRGKRSSPRARARPWWGLPWPHVRPRWPGRAPRRLGEWCALLERAMARAAAAAQAWACPLDDELGRRWHRTLRPRARHRPARSDADRGQPARIPGWKLRAHRGPLERTRRGDPPPSRWTVGLSRDRVDPSSRFERGRRLDERAPPGAPHPGGQARDKLAAPIDDLRTRSNT